MNLSIQAKLKFIANTGFLAKLGANMVGGNGEGHFDYGNVVPGLDARLKRLATFIYSKGLK